MAEQNTIDEIIGCIDESTSFLVEAGAGSGKTRALTDTLRYILEKKTDILATSHRQIACITYTNVAKEEIISRIDSNSLVLVGTIHEFLWGVIKNFQTEIKESIVEISNTEGEELEGLKSALEHQLIEYSQYGRNFINGQISHNEVITISSIIFDKYPKISRIISDKFPYIFVDEYQDTNEKVVETLIEKLLPSNEDKLVIGFFGDSMQKIYNDGVGKVSSPRLKVITKTENYRCSLAVVGLLNNIRPDLQQIAMNKPIDGSVAFYLSRSNDKEGSFAKVTNHIFSNQGWEEEDTKVLMLTHKGIAEELDYKDVLTAYGKLSFGRDKLMRREEPFSKLFEKIERLLSLYQEKKYGEFLKVLSYKITDHKSKKELSNIINELIELRLTGNIEEIINYVFDKELINKSKDLVRFERKIQDPQDDSDSTRKKKSFYELLSQVPYAQIISANNYIEERTPFSTKHGVKGAEYTNVIVAIDDQAWNQYKYEDMFKGNKANTGRYERTLNLFYVCCSRAKNNLAVVSLSEMSGDSLEVINNWFDEENVYDIDAL